MTKRSRGVLKGWFRRGCYPTESQFGDLIDSFVHLGEDRIPMLAVAGLTNAINSKLNKTEVEELKREHGEIVEAQRVLSARVNEVTPKLLLVEDLDTMGYGSLLDFWLSAFEDDEGYSRYAVMRRLGTRMVTAGLLDVVRDSSGHTVTQIYGTKDVLEDGSFANRHNDWKVRWYIRHFNAAQSSTSAIVGQGEWSAWEPLEKGMIEDAREDVGFEAFVVLWNIFCGSYGRYNRTTGFFELNGITDITYEEARKIFRCMQMPPSPRRLDDTGLRTNLWVGNTLSEYDMNPNLSRLFRCATLERIRVSTDGAYGCLPATIDRMFARSMPELTEVLGVIDCHRLTDQTIAPAYADQSFPKCHTLKLKCIDKNVQVAGFSALSSQSLKYWIENATNTEVITITVHEDVYAKLNGTYDWGDNNSEGILWAAVLQKAMYQRITFAVKS